MSTKPKTETVLVTGAAGTVGAYVVQEVLKAGHRVVAVDRPNSRWDHPKGAAIESSRRSARRIPPSMPPVS